MFPSDYIVNLKNAIMIWLLITVVCYEHGPFRINNSSAPYYLKSQYHNAPFIYMEFTLCTQFTCFVNMYRCLKNYFSKNQYGAPRLRSVFKPIYIILSVLGLFPYSVQLQNTKNEFSIIQKSIYLNMLCAMSHIILIGAFLVLHIQRIYYSIEDNALTEGIMTQMNYIIELFALVLFCVVAYICVFLNRFRYVKTLNMLSALIDAPNINSEMVLDRIRFQIYIVIGSLSLLLLMQIAVNYTRHDSIYKMFLVVFTFILPQMIQFTTIAFFYLLVMIVVEIFRNIRKHLTTQLDKMTHEITRVGSRDGNLTLRQIELIYIEAFTIKQNVNQMFEAPILVTMMQCFHAVVSESHIIYHGIVVMRNLGTHDIANCSIWIIYQLIKIYAIANAGNSFILEVSLL